MYLKGTFSALGPEELLEILSSGEKTGLLDCTADGRGVKIWLEAGRITAVWGSDPASRLGDWLLHRRLLAPEALRAALEAEKTSEAGLVGELLGRGLMTEATLVAALEKRAGEVVQALLSWQEGRFEFLPGELAGLPVEVALTVERVLASEAAMTVEAPIDDPDAAAGDPPAGPDRGSELVEVSEGLELELVPEAPRPEAQRPLPATEAAGGAAVDTEPSPADPVESRSGAEPQRIEPEPEAEATAPEVEADAGPVAPRVRKVKTDTEPVLIEPEADPEGTSAATPLKPLTELDRLLESGEFIAARRLLSDFTTSNGDVEGAENLQASAITTYLDTCYGRILPRQGVPRVVLAEREVMKDTLSPQEYFMLSRINGLWDVQSIVKLSPMPELEAVAILAGLVERGVVRVDLEGW